jgi:hypothetical protein
MCGGVCPDAATSLLPPPQLLPADDARLGRVLAHVRPAGELPTGLPAGVPWCREVAPDGNAGDPPRAAVAVLASQVAAAPAGADAAAAIGPAKAAALAAVERHAPALEALSAGIWAHPELNFAEHWAHDAIAGFLEEKLGCEVERHYLGLETAFRCAAGAGAPQVVICAEYDALPQIGHACGHNLIAEAAVAAFAGVQAALAAGAAAGTVVLLGTPAEEGGGGKVDYGSVALSLCPTPHPLHAIIANIFGSFISEATMRPNPKVDLLDRGGFAAADCAMMVHPAPTDGPHRGSSFPSDVVSPSLTHSIT